MVLDSSCVWREGVLRQRGYRQRWVLSLDPRAECAHNYQPRHPARRHHLEQADLVEMRSSPAHLPRESLNRACSDYRVRAVTAARAGLRFLPSKPKQAAERFPDLILEILAGRGLQGQLALSPQRRLPLLGGRVRTGSGARIGRFEKAARLDADGVGDQEDVAQLKVDGAVEDLAEPGAAQAHLLLE